MSRGSPKLPVRVPTDDQQRYRQAAEHAGMEFSEWVRRALGRVAYASEWAVRAATSDASEDQAP